MSDPFAPGAAPDEPDAPEERAEREEDLAALPAPAPARRPGAVRRAVTGRRSRWVAGGLAALVLIGGTAAVTAVVVHHSGERVAVAVGPGGLPGLKQMIAERGGALPGGMVVVKGGRVAEVPGGVLPGGADQLSVPGTVGGAAAPAPLPSLAADQAVTKAETAVTGGKVESLTSVPEQGGGSAWQAVVLGPDGVRHLVTLDGTSGSVTSNTVMN